MNREDLEVIFYVYSSEFFYFSIVEFFDSDNVSLFEKEFFV